MLNKTNPQHEVFMPAHVSQRVVPIKTPMPSLPKAPKNVKPPLQALYIRLLTMLRTKYQSFKVTSRQTSEIVANKIFRIYINSSPCFKNIASAPPFCLQPWDPTTETTEQSRAGGILQLEAIGDGIREAAKRTPICILKADPLAASVRYSKQQITYNIYVYAVYAFSFPDR